MPLLRREGGPENEPQARIPAERLCGCLPWARVRERRDSPNSSVFKTRSRSIPLSR